MDFTYIYKHSFHQIENKILGVEAKLGSLYCFCLAMFCTGISFLFYFPDFELYFSYYKILDLISQNPFDSNLYSNVITKYSTDSGTLVHYQNSQFRLFVPVLLYVTKMPAISTLWIQLSLLPFFFYVLYKFLSKYIDNSTTLFFITVGFCFTFPVKSFLYLRPFYTSIAYLFLLLILNNKNSWVRLLLMMCSAFLDERALMYSFLILAFEWLFNRKQEILVPAILLAVSVISIVYGVRYFLITQFDFKQPLQLVGTEVLLQNFTLAPLSILMAIDGGMIYIVLGVIAASIKRDQMVMSFATVSILLGILGGLCVMDINKSISYLFVLELIMLVYLSKNISKVQLCHFSVLILFLNLCIPNYYIWSGTNSVYWLSPMFPKIFKYLL